MRTDHAGCVVESLEQRALLSTFTVTSNSDTGPGSLRQAILDANSAPGADVIEFDGSLSGQTIASTGGELAITDDLTINGPGADNLTIDALGAGRAFRNEAATTINGLRIVNGVTTGNGAAVYNTGSLTLSGVEIDDCNSADLGGAIGTGDGSTLVLIGSVIADSGASTMGGGIYAGPGSTVSLTDTTISNTGSGVGGGIYLAATADLTLTRATISNASAATRGGGLFAAGQNEVTIAHSSITGGSSGGNGAGAYFDDDSESTITDTTISTNASTASGGGVFLSGGTHYWARLTMADNTAAVFGGAVGADSNNTLLLAQSTLTNNTAAAKGGAVQFAGGQLIILTSTLSGNASTADGGGAVASIVDAEIQIISSTIADNSASGTGGGVLADDGTLTVLESTFSGNTALAGAAVFTRVVTEIINSTLSDNTATNEGGAVYTSAELIIRNSTIVLNQAGGTAGQEGGGIFNSAGSVTLHSTILAGNTGNGNPQEYYGSDPIAPASAHNLIGDAATAGGLTDGANDNIVGDDPMLAPLASNGGPTKTHALLPGSPAIDAGSNTTNQSNDQRGARFKRVSATPDIGAFETQNLALVVDTATDVVDGNYDTNQLSLREAVALANANGQADTITFAASLSGATITLTAGQIVISDSLTITGPGMDNLVIDANGAGRHFSVTDGDDGNVLDVAISGLHLRNGSSTTSGGAIWNDENLTLDDVSLTGNSATDSGGAIHHAANTLTITSSVISDNAAAAFGGAVDAVGGSLEITDSTISANTAATGAGLSLSGLSQATISRSLLAANNASQYGGGLYAIDLPLVVQNSTFSGNTAGQGGGGLAVQAASGSITIANSTIADNEGTFGGGLYVSGAGTVLRSTIVAGNTNGSAPSDIANASVTGSFNLIGDSNSAGGLSNGVDGNIVGQDPLLGELADNGGPTMTHALLAGSPAIDAGSNTDNLATDQRGADRVRGGGVDIGAFEANARPTLEGFEASASQIAQGGTILLSVGNAADSDGSIAGVRYSADLDGDGIADQVLGTSTSSGDGYSFTIPASASKDFPLDGVTIIAEAVDDEGFASLPLDVDLSVLFSLRAGDGSAVEGSATSDNELWTGFVNEAGDVVIFASDAGVAYHLGLEAGAPAATGDVIVYTDPKDGLVYAAYPAADGLILARRESDGSWTFRNLSTVTGVDAADSPTRALTQMVSTSRTGRVVIIAGLDADGRIVAFQQDGASDGGHYTWDYADISADLDAQSMDTPAFTDLISYVTPWNSWTIAGIDGDGNIQGVWVAPASFSMWRVDNLSAITGAPPISGQLTVTQTSWSAINLGGVNDDGHLVVTWWIPSFKGDWVTSDLTTVSGGETLVAGRATGFVTPWGAINYAGLNADGEVAAYWWTPSTNAWTVTPLTSRFDDSMSRPTGEMTSYVSDSGTMSLLGADADGDVTRVWWTPNDDGLWKLTDLTGSVVRA